LPHLTCCNPALRGGRSDASADSMEAGQIASVARRGPLWSIYGVAVHAIDARCKLVVGGADDDWDGGGEHHAGFMD
jgi:hypothetical protein